MLCAVKCTVLLETDIWPTSALTLRVMHLILALVKSPSSRTIHDWRGRCGEKGRGKWTGSRKGEERPWIKLLRRDVVQWAAFAVRYKAYDRWFSRKRITAPSLKPSMVSWVLKGIPHHNTQSFHNCQHAFFPAATTQTFTPACHIQRQTCSHISPLSYIHPHVHTSNTQTICIFSPLFSFYPDSGVCLCMFQIQQITEHDFKQTNTADLLWAVKFT